MAQLFYHTPLGSGSKDSKIVILVDCSGSMSGNRWDYIQLQTNRLINTVGKDRVILITCGENGKVVPDKELRADINYHSSTLECGSGTDFLNGLIALEEAVANEGASDKPLKIVFISDGGEDLTMEDLRQNLQGSKISTKPINFFSVGVSADYPTKYANMFRVLYHTGSATPELFHISNQDSKKLYRRKFDLLIPYLMGGDEEKILVDPPQYEFPFSTTKTNMLPPDHWFTSTDSSVKINGKICEGQTNLAPKQAEKLLSQFHTSIVSNGINKDSAEESSRKAKACEPVIKGAISSLTTAGSSAEVEEATKNISAMSQNIAKLQNKALDLRTMKDSEGAKVMEAATIKIELPPAETEEQKVTKEDESKTEYLTEKPAKAETQVKEEQCKNKESDEKIKEIELKLLELTEKLANEEDRKAREAAKRVLEEHRIAREVEEFEQVKEGEFEALTGHSYLSQLSGLKSGLKFVKYFKSFAF